MSINLDKNFKFLNNHKDYILINEIIELVNNICIKMSKNEFDSLAISSRKILEIIVNDIIENNPVSIDKKSNLHDKIKAIRECEYEKYDYDFTDKCHFIKNKGNKSAHETKSKITFNDALYILDSIYYILRVHFDEKLDEVMDMQLYIFKSNDGESSNLLKDNNSLNSYKKSIQIWKKNIKEWMELDDRNLLIPIYQRKYSWTIGNIEQLLSDIDDRRKDNRDHYYGTVAVKEVENFKGEKVIKIIDGQQRLTTSIILICATRDYLITRGDNELKILSKILSKSNFQNFLINPVSNEELNSIFKDMLNKEFIKNNPNKNENICLNYNYIIDFYKKNKMENYEIYTFINTYLNNFQTSVIYFNENEFTQKNEMEIFENMNSKGKQLSIYDLVKNHLFTLCNENELNNSGEYEEKINYLYKINVENKLENYLSKNESKWDAFFRTISFYERGEELSGKEVSIIFNSIRKSIESLFLLEKKENLNLKEFEKFLKIIGDYIQLYSSIIDLHNCKFLCDILDIENIVSLVFDKKKRTLFIPLTFLLFEKISKSLSTNLNDIEDIPNSDKEYIKKCYLEILNFYIKSSVITKQGDSDIKRYIFEIFKEISLSTKNDFSIKRIYEELLNAMKKLPESLSYALFKNKLKDPITSNELLKTILMYIEKDMTNSWDLNESQERNSKSLEYIIPKDATKWIKEYEKKVNFKGIEYWNDQHIKNVDKIGNCAIIDKILDTKIKNEIFTIKNEKIYKKSMSRLLANDDKNIDVSSKKEWTFDDIDKRTNKLAEYILTNLIKY